MLAWFLGGVLTLLGAFCYAELSSAFPRTGGDYVYLSMAYGKWAGFLYGWSKLVIIRTGNIALMAVMFGRNVGRLLPGDSDTGFGIITAEMGLAVIAIAALTSINIVGLRFGRDAHCILSTCGRPAWPD